MRHAVLVLLASLLFAGCAHAISSPAIPASGPSTTALHACAQGDACKIQHVVFIIQENRTFDNIFGGPNPFPDADAVSFGQLSNGTTVPLKEVNFEKPVFSGGDPNNYHFQWMTACNAPSPPPWPVGQPAPCRMNGFDQNAKQQTGYPKPVGVGTIYSYVNRSETKPYWFIAQHYALGDHFFMGHNSESYTAHQYIFSSQSHGTVDAPVFPSSTSCGLLHDYCAYTPWGCDSPNGTMTYGLNATTGQYTAPPAKPAGPAPCFGQHGGYPSIADLALAKNVSWRLYAYSMCSNIIGLNANYTIRHANPSIWPHGQQMSGCNSDYGLYSPLLANSTHFRAQQYTFVGDESGGMPLANITWILPGPYTSDHPGIPFGDCGPTWVAQAIDAIGASPDWKSTAVFVFWDDWGGFYDHVPPYVVRDQVGPGFRVPLLVISPYARTGQVVHTNIEFGTLNKFVEQTFGLGSLNATDASPYLNNLNAFFNFNQTPQKFTKIPFPSYLRCNYLPGEMKAQQQNDSRWLRMVGSGDNDD
ncbi:MAG TPA: alkaline phosphatase family protein [Candidatus Baltobacteraceae bacterium]|nr:alkaline phosphatase family protein [Candidatus Baltobacteraceae bacterium]